jgi:hypothetical protein
MLSTKPEILTKTLLFGKSSSWEAILLPSHRNETLSLSESPPCRTWLFLATFAVAWSPLRGQSGTPSQLPQQQVGAQEPLRTAQASRVDQIPKLDGTLDDPLWLQATPISNFLQREPYEGQAPTERIEVRVLYDKHEVYFGITCFDSDPKGIVATELRRDLSQELDDSFEIIIDSSHDRRNANVFQSKSTRHATRCFEHRREGQ